MTPYAAFVTAVFIVGAVVTAWALCRTAADADRRAVVLLPMPAPDAPQAEFDAWVAEALGIVRADQRAAFERTADQIRSLPEVQS